MLLWDGACMVHEIFSIKKLIQLKSLNPDAEIIAHPECEEEILQHADFIGSTTALLNYTKKSSSQKFIVLTETGILHQMQKANPLKSFIPAPPENNCACNDCPHMKLNTIEKIYIALKHEQPELIMNENLINEAKKPILKMLELSAKFGL